MPIKPWKKVGPPETLAQSNGRSLVWQKYQDPRNKEIKRYTLFKAEGFSCVVLPITKKGMVLAIRQFRHGSEIISLELPAGNHKYPEQSPESVAREEVAEETGGYEPEKVTRLTNEAVNLEPCYSKWLFYPFLFTDCQKTNLEAKPDEGEYIEVVPIPLPEWMEMCFNGQIGDTLSMFTTMLASKHLGYKLQL